MKSKKNIFLILTFFILYIIINSISLISETKDWFYETFNMQKQDESEKKIDARIKNGFFPSGIYFDGLNLTILFTKSFPYKINKIIEWKIESCDPEKEKIINLLKINLLKGFFPINISFSDIIFMCFFIKIENDIKFESFNFATYPFDIKKKDESYKIISKYINDYLSKGFIINGFSMDKSNFYILYTKPQQKYKVKNWSIEWVFTQNYAFSNYLIDLKNKNRKIIGIFPDEEFLVVMWIED